MLLNKKKKTGNPKNRILSRNVSALVLTLFLEAVNTRASITDLPEPHYRANSNVVHSKLRDISLDKRIKSLFSYSTRKEIELVSDFLETFQPVSITQAEIDHLLTSGNLGEEIRSSFKKHLYGSSSKEREIATILEKNENFDVPNKLKAKLNNIADKIFNLSVTSREINLLYKQALEGNAFSCFNLGIYHSMMNDSQAFSYFRQSARLGYVPAISVVGYVYQHGILGIHKNFPLSAELFKLAEALGDSRTEQHYTKLIESKVYVSNEDKPIVKRYYETATDITNPRSRRSSKKFMAYRSKEKFKKKAKSFVGIVGTARSMIS